MAPEDLHRHLDHQHLQIVDVRAAEEWATGHLPGSAHIPLAELSGRMGELDPTSSVIAVCDTGSRSAQAAQQLTQAGFTADHLDGGLHAWQRHGGELHHAHEPPAGSHFEPLAELAVDPEEVHTLVLQLAEELQAHFGDREPSDAEVHQFLRQRLHAEGRSESEIEQIMNEVTG
jgi:rhodanese-related sulfurtransferase